mmetsp:Transcript_10627/g.31078  ORF Transcript_10627/g.31078 Transcript_10627/m.31078 type:complete len:95 (-) Transcript_10627:1146-1430(-)
MRPTPPVNYSIFYPCLYFAQGARVVAMLAILPPGAALAHGALVTGIGGCSWGLVRNVSVGGVGSSVRDGVHVQGNNLEKTKCWTTTFLSNTSPW